MAKKIDDVDANKSNSTDILLQEFRIGLIKLGLKGIEDLNNKRVQNPTDFYNSLTALYNAVKDNGIAHDTGAN